MFIINEHIYAITTVDTITTLYIGKGVIADINKNENDEKIYTVWLYPYNGSMVQYCRESDKLIHKKFSDAVKRFKELEHERSKNDTSK